MASSLPPFRSAIQAVTDPCGSMKESPIVGAARLVLNGHPLYHRHARMQEFNNATRTKNRAPREPNPTQLPLPGIYPTPHGRDPVHEGDTPTGNGPFAAEQDPTPLHHSGDPLDGRAPIYLCLPTSKRPFRPLLVLAGA